ncbi:hypothetical protein ACIPY0_20080 [Paenarthrobacter nicotinovorans]|uniref:hypothetical protein n=2 Tax=Paenarthrobacter nicotinovorans TaxID=29320 RepID=UPI0038205FC3
MSLQLPRPSDLPTTAAPTAATKQLRKGRTSVGIALLVVGAFNIYSMIWAYSTYGYLLETLTASQKSEVVVADTLVVLLILALVGVGIWNILARRSPSLMPLIAALVIAVISLASDLLSIVDTVEVNGSFPYFILFLQFGLTVQTIRLLRLKPDATEPDSGRGQASQNVE